MPAINLEDSRWILSLLDRQLGRQATNQLTSNELHPIEKQVLEDSVAYLNGITAYKEIVVFIYDESASVQEHDTTASALRGIDRISDVIIVSRPSQLARPALRRQPADTAKPARQTARK